MLIQSTAAGQLQAAKSPLSPGGSETVASTNSSPQDQYRKTVEYTQDDWGVAGQKPGALALVAAGTSIIPFQALVRFPSMPIPAAIALSIGTMAGLSIEERKLGLGKNLGGLVGKTFGTAVGHGKASLGLHRVKSDGPVQLERKNPNEVKKFDTLAQRALHLATGKAPKRTRAVEMGELVGATAGVMATSYVLPKILTAVAGESSVVASVAGSLVGPLAGMVVGGWQENTLGLGRATGELVGWGLSRMGVGDTMPEEMKATPYSSEKGEPGALKKAFLSLNKAIAEPIIGPLVDATVATNGLFAEKPVQTMSFSPRPLPTVNRERLTKNFIELASIYGPSGEEELVSEAVAKKAKALGATIETKDDGSVIATLKASPGFEDSPTVMLSAHLDTVEPTNPDAIRVTDYKIHTDGKHILGADDRAGIAEIFEGLESVLEQKQPHPELKLVFPVDEERGLRGAARMEADEISNRPTLGYVVDALDVASLHLTNDAVLLTPRSKKYSFKQSDPLVQVALRSMAQSGTKPLVRHAPILTGAGSDANTPAFNSGHIRSLAVGVGETNMHTGMEQIKLDDLERAAQHVVGYITNACDLKVEGEEIIPRYQTPAS